MGLNDIKGYMIGIILAIVIVTSGVLIITDFKTIDSTIDNTNQLEQFNNTFAKAEEITTSVENVRTSIDNVQSESSTGVLGWLNTLVGSAFNGLKALGNTLGFVDVAAKDTANIFPIPLAIITLITLIVVIIIGFAIWSAIFKV